MYIKEYTDQEGRWIALDSSLERQKVTIMNMYAPNVMSPDFFNEICNIIRNIGNQNIILGGDFNQVRNAQLDKSSYKQNIPVIYTAIDTMVDECGLIDIWRTLHPLEKDFTFFSHPHGSYSRTDYILISKQLVSQVQSASIGNIVLSDHAPVYVVLTTSNYNQNTRWRFNYCKLRPHVPLYSHQ